MYLCYVDESGTSTVPGNTSHFILAGIALPIQHWRDADNDVTTVLAKFGLASAELHTAWLVRAYSEQEKIAGFATLDWAARRSAVDKARKAELLRLQSKQKIKAYKQAKKTFAHTADYIHLTRAERATVVRDVADCVSRWTFAWIFAECIDKVHFDPARTSKSVDEQAFEQVISRFEQFLVRTPDQNGSENYGLIIHDNNQTVAQKHTQLMRQFHSMGTLWTKINRTIETPLFVDSSLTRMVQIADLCSYALRRYCENNETDLMQRIFQRVDRYQNRAVGIRHFAGLACKCEVCEAHHRGRWIK